MLFPTQVPVSYTNPQGNLIASGLYRSYITQDIANDFPQWMHLRDSQKSVGQQLIASEAILLEWLQNDLEYNIRSKFLLTSPLEDIDVLYSVPVPGTINLLNASASGIRCIAAPSGYQISGANQIQVQGVTLLEDFYYNVLPTRIEVISSGVYEGTINGTSFNIIPSGILDKQSKLYDKWKNKHRITWCSANGSIMKQDAVTMESYETYPWDDTGSVSDMWYSDGFLWCLGNDTGGSYVSLLSSKTQIPQATYLDYLARFDFNVFMPSGTTATSMMIDASGFMWVADSTKSYVLGIAPRYDYFVFDQKTRSVYFREDYRSSGVFLSNT